MRALVVDGWRAHGDTTSEFGPGAGTVGKALPLYMLRLLHLLAQARVQLERCLPRDGRDDDAKAAARTEAMAEAAKFLDSDGSGSSVGGSEDDDSDGYDDADEAVELVDDLDFLCARGAKSKKGRVAAGTVATMTTTTTTTTTTIPTTRIVTSLVIVVTGGRRRRRYFKGHGSAAGVSGNFFGHLAGAVIAAPFLRSRRMQAPEPPPPPSPDAKPATAAEKRRRSRQRTRRRRDDDEDGEGGGGGGVGGGSSSRSSSSSGGGCIGGGVGSHASLLPRAALEGQWLSPAEAAGRAAEVSFLLEVLEPYTAA